MIWAFCAGVYFTLFAGSYFYRGCKDIAYGTNTKESEVYKRELKTNEVKRKGNVCENWKKFWFSRRTKISNEEKY